MNTAYAFKKGEGLPIGDSIYAFFDVSHAALRPCGYKFSGSLAIEDSNLFGLNGGGGDAGHRQCILRRADYVTS